MRARTSWGTHVGRPVNGALWRSPCAWLAAPLQGIAHSRCSMHTKGRTSWSSCERGFAALSLRLAGRLPEASAARFFALVGAGAATVGSSLQTCPGCQRLLRCRQSARSFELSADLIARISCCSCSPLLRLDGRRCCNHGTQPADMLRLFNALQAVGITFVKRQGTHLRPASSPWWAQVLRP